MRISIAALIIFLILCQPLFAGAPEELRMEKGRFSLLYRAGDEGIATELIREAPVIGGRIIGDIGMDFAEKTEIRLCPTLEAFRDAQPGNTRVPLWAVGVAYPEENVIVLRSPRAVKGSPVDVIGVFAHEFSHIAIGRALKGVAIPVWLDEGLAIYEAREWNFSRLSVLTRAVLMDRLIPLAVLTRAFPVDEREAELAYAESFMFISFLINKVGRGAFHRLIRDYTRYGDLEGALRRGTGMSRYDLEGQWLTYLTLRVSWIPLITSVSTFWFAAALVFIYAYVRKRRQARERLQEMAEEEAEVFS